MENVFCVFSFVLHFLIFLPLIFIMLETIILKFSQPSQNFQVFQNSISLFTPTFGTLKTFFICRKELQEPSKQFQVQKRSFALFLTWTLDWFLFVSLVWRSEQFKRVVFEWNLKNKRVRKYFPLRKTQKDLLQIWDIHNFCHSTIPLGNETISFVLKTLIFELLLQNQKALFFENQVSWIYFNDVSMWKLKLSGGPSFSVFSTKKNLKIRFENC